MGIAATSSVQPRLSSKWFSTVWTTERVSGSSLHRLLMSTGCKSSHNGFLDVSRSNGWLRISGWIGQLSCSTIFSTSLSVAAFLRRGGGSMLEGEHWKPWETIYDYTLNYYLVLPDIKWKDNSIFDSSLCSVTANTSVFQFFTVLHFSTILKHSHTDRVWPTGRVLASFLFTSLSSNGWEFAQFLCRWTQHNTWQCWNTRQSLQTHGKVREHDVVENGNMW